MSTHFLISMEKLKAYFDGCPDDLKDFLEEGKEISLDDNDISIKIFQVYPQLASMDSLTYFQIEQQVGRRAGYEKALLDLKK